MVALVEPTGLDGDGNSWSMVLTELFWIEDGKVTDIWPFWWDIVEFSRIADSLRRAASDDPATTTAQRQPMRDVS